MLYSEHGESKKKQEASSLQNHHPAGAECRVIGYWDTSMLTLADVVRAPGGPSISPPEDMDRLIAR